MINKIWQYDPHTLVVSFNIAGNAASIDLSFEDGQVIGSALGRDTQLKRHLRNTLVGKARLVIDSTERHILGTWLATDTQAIVQGVTDWTSWLKNQAETAPTEYDPSLSLSSDHIGVFWWDNRSNFGDAIGPWLVERLTGSTPVNSRRVKHEGRSLMTVGSIIGHLDRDHVDIWGTGLMGPLADARLKRLASYEDVKVRAVRGHKTAYDLRKQLGWHVPDIYGDPGLLLPRFYKPRKSAPASDAVAVVPHYAHAKYFPPATNENTTHIVDVAQGLEKVIDEISSAHSCISTSLHGIIIAQAYGVPWIWLRIEDHQLGGDQYKFDDFLSTLAPGPVPRLDVVKDQVSKLNFKQLAENAFLPELNTSLDDLLGAFPRAQSA
ncbi:polysaccharide pyruvyl transferase family protein, partial [Arthrobacter rhombi]|uniref:polysaccharide pyruvyl transferase family protein n=1 Tax=Arthrobacter rhombi TaxID=71253 RepID=UPI003FD0EA9C